MKFTQIELSNGIILWIKPDTKECLLSDKGGWLPGCYENEEAARKGATQFNEPTSYTRMQKLQDSANLRAGGTGGHITLADLS